MARRCRPSEDYTAVPAVQPTKAHVPDVQARVAEMPAVQSRVAYPPAEQSRSPAGATPQVQATAAASAPPAVQVMRVETELPAVQTPDPLAISPKGTRIGDSYFDFIFDILSVHHFQFIASITISLAKSISPRESISKSLNILRKETSPLHGVKPHLLLKRLTQDAEGAC